MLVGLLTFKTESFVLNSLPPCNVKPQGEPPERTTSNVSPKPFDCELNLYMVPYRIDVHMLACDPMAFQEKLAKEATCFPLPNKAPKPGKICVCKCSCMQMWPSSLSYFHTPCVKARPGHRCPEPSMLRSKIP